MNVKEFYQAANSNYNDALSIMMNDFLIERMINKFMNDNSYAAMIEMYEKKDYRNLFATAHAFKGVTGNLALTPLYEIASIITEATRNSDDVNLDNEIKQLKDAYSLVEQAYKKYAK